MYKKIPLFNISRDINYIKFFLYLYDKMPLLPYKEKNHFKLKNFFFAKLKKNYFNKTIKILK